MPSNRAILFVTFLLFFYSSATVIRDCASYAASALSPFVLESDVLITTDTANSCLVFSSVNAIVIDGQGHNLIATNMIGARNLLEISNSFNISVINLGIINGTTELRNTHGVTIINCTFTTGGETSFRADAFNRSSITGSTITGDRFGISLASSTSAVISGNTIKASNGIYIQAVQSNVTISHNQVTIAGSASIGKGIFGAFSGPDNVILHNVITVDPYSPRFLIGIDIFCYFSSATEFTFNDNVAIMKVQSALNCPTSITGFIFSACPIFAGSVNRSIYHSMLCTP